MRMLNFSPLSALENFVATGDDLEGHGRLTQEPFLLGFEKNSSKWLPRLNDRQILKFYHTGD